MKISSIPPEPTYALGGALNGQNSEAASAAMTSTGLIPMPQVQVLLDSQVKLLLSELSKMLDRQSAQLKELPPDIASVAEQKIKQPLIGEEVIPNGMAAILKGQKNVVQGLNTLANTLEEAAALKQVFPDGLPEFWSDLAGKFERQAVKLGPDLAKSIITLATALAEQSSPVSGAPAALQQAARQLLNTLSRKDFSIPTQELATKLPDLLNKLIDNFEKQLSNQSPVPADKNNSTATLRQVCQQLIKNLLPTDAQQNKPPLVFGLPAILDDVIESFENQIVITYPALEKDVLVANLRQILGQLLRNLPEADQNAFSRLISQMQESIPDKLRLATMLHNAPELREAWVLLRLADAKEWLTSSRETLQQAGKTLRELAAVVQKPTEHTAELANTQKNAITLAIPLYLGEEKKPYPAYIHLFKDREEGRGKSPEGFVPDTWLRICLATENVGIVDMVFHMYGDKQLSIRINFSDTGTADKFREHISDIRAKLGESPIALTEIGVSPAQSD